MDLTILIGLHILGIIALLYFKQKQTQAAEAARNHPDDKVIRSRYNLALAPGQEKSIKIQKLWLFPMRGIMGIEVDHLKVSKFGIKYDREWAIYDKEKLGCVGQAAEVKLTQFRQRIEKDLATKQKYLVISLLESCRDQAPKDVPYELRIPIRKNLTGDIVDTGKVQGIAEGEVYDRWFSKIIGREVILLRAAPNFKKGLPLNLMKWGKDEDLTRGFVSKCVLHLVNEASTRDLEKRVLAQYPDEAERSRIKVTSMAFRPNITIDTQFAYEEDRMLEARVGNTMIRLVGYCNRCKAVANNYETNDRNPELEPNPTINKYRKHPELGNLFGTYHQVDIIESPEQFQRLLPDYDVPRDRKFDSVYGIVRAGDEIKVRVSEQRIEFDPS